MADKEALGGSSFLPATTLQAFATMASGSGPWAWFLEPTAIPTSDSQGEAYSSLLRPLQPL